MTEQEAPATAEAGQEREIVFKGRTMWVRIPRPEQLLVWQRTLKQLQGADVSGWNGSQVLIALERTRKIIDSVLVHETDKTWLDDQMLEGSIDLMDTAEIINKTVEAFGADGNREERRTAKKTTKARRKAVTPAS